MAVIKVFPHLLKMRGATMSEFGKYLRVRRKSAALTQVEVGEAIGVSGAMVSHYEKGTHRPEYGNLRSLARILKTDYDELLSVFDGTPTGAKTLMAVRGELALDVFKGPSAKLERAFIPMASDPRFPASAQYALCVATDDFEPEVHKGEYLIVVDLAGIDATPRPGALVVVERYSGNLTERTVRRYPVGDGAVVAAVLYSYRVSPDPF
jgi:transcriptional regulator with XRE-family HTH domain